MHWTIRFTEVFYSNETEKLNKENSTLVESEVGAEHCDGTITTDTRTNGTDGSFDISDKTNSTNQHILKYIVKQNKTDSQENNKKAHYKNALKRKRRASSGIFDPHPALATLPLHIITDDDFYPVVDDTVLTTPKPFIKENLKATAPQVFPLFTPIPVLPPGYLERYNVTTEVKHPVVNKKVELEKPKISKTNTNPKSQSHYRDEQSDDEIDKPRFNNFKSDNYKFKEYNSELDEFKKPYKPTNKNNDENYKPPDNDKKNKENNKNEDSNKREKTQKDHEPQRYRPSNRNNKPKSYDFAPKRDPTNKYRPTHDSRYFNEEERENEESHYENENKNPHYSKHSPKDNLNNEERYYKDEKHRSVAHKSIPSEDNHYEDENKTPPNYKDSLNENFNDKERYYSDEKRGSGTLKSSPLEDHYENEDKPHQDSKHVSNENVDEKQSSVAHKSNPLDDVHERKSHYQNEKKNQHRISDEGNNGDNDSEENEFEQTHGNLNTKNDLTEPHFKQNGNTTSDVPRKINNEDSVEDYDEEANFDKSNEDIKYTNGFVHDYTPRMNKNPENYKHYHTQDNSSENINNAESYNIKSGHRPETSDEIEKVPFNKQSGQKLRSNKFIPKNIEDDGSSANDEVIDIHNKDDRSDEDEEQHSKPSAHFKNVGSDYQNVNIYSNPSDSSEDNYDEAEDKKESESLSDDINSQESGRIYPKHRSSDSSDNEKSYHPSQTHLQTYSDHVEGNGDKLSSTESTSYDNYIPPNKSFEHLKQSQGESSEENFNQDHRQENASQEIYNQQKLPNKLSKNIIKEDSDENVSSEENYTQLRKPYDIHPDDDTIENNRHDAGSTENFEDESIRKPKLLFENYQTHDYPSRTPSGFSKGNIGLSDGNSKSNYRTFNQPATPPAKGHINEQTELFTGNNDENKKAKISYETFHPSVQEYPKRIPTGFSKGKTDNVHATISYETYHPKVIGSSEEIRDYGNLKPTLSYETYHPSPGPTEFHKSSPKEESNENIDNNEKLKTSYKTYHPKINTEEYSQKISNIPELEFSQTPITSTINPKISYETYHPLNPEPSQKKSQSDVISNHHIEQETGNVRPTQYFEIYSQVHTPINVPNNDNSHHTPDKTSYITKEVQGKPPKKYEPKKIFNDYNKFNPYENLYPDAIKKVPKLPMFYSKKHSELPSLTTKGSSGNVKQQFERIPLDYMHDSQKPRKPQLSDNLSYHSSEQINDDLSSKENDKYTKNSKQSDKYKPDLEIKLDDIKLDLPEIKLPESVLLYDSEEKEESENNGDKKENYQVKEYNDDDEGSDETEEAEDEEAENYGPVRQPKEDDDSPKYEDNKQPDDDLYGKFFNDNIDLYESFVQDHFNKKGTFAERSQQIIEDPVLKSTMQDVLRRVREAKKSKDPKYGYMWTLNYGRPL